MRIVNKKSNLKVKLPKRGYSINVLNEKEKLIIVKGPNVDYKKFGRSIKEAFSPDLHLFVEIIRVGI